MCVCVCVGVCVCVCVGGVGVCGCFVPVWALEGMTLPGKLCCNSKRTYICYISVVVYTKLSHIKLDVQYMQRLTFRNLRLIWNSNRSNILLRHSSGRRPAGQWAAELRCRISDPPLWTRLHPCLPFPWPPAEDKCRCPATTAALWVVQVPAPVRLVEPPFMWSNPKRTASRRARAVVYYTFGRARGAL